MQFRPCIDIHNGKVKQIVGSSLRDQGDQAKDNFVAAHDAAYYATLYREEHLQGGHVILLNAADSPYYLETRRQAMSALAAYPGGLQVGGGITAENATEYMRAGASHVIVSSYVFKGGHVLQNRLNALVKEVGKEHIVLDLSCRKSGDFYYIVTDRWQTMTQIPVIPETLEELAAYCDEFLIHAVDVEGKNGGIELPLIELLSGWNRLPITYAGGVHNMEDLALLKKAGEDKIGVTIGTALELFGGTMKLQDVINACRA
ncbi:MAG: phosphoribosylformimino-5-aminoimidazole carboxamide ribotide isomerase [Lachnospiraceae bacterium]|nr:phosphoribosylformimino-5-aminoimidazole carboxamide ribotide isomerase [Lachnospiraceae bacterium]